MYKLGVVFPGQGAQYVGMGKDFYDHSERARDIFTDAHNILDEDVAHLCFEGPQELLDQTVNTQTTILTADIAAYETFTAEAAIVPAVMAGHSLGEYAALYAAGALSFHDTLTLVRARAICMRDAVPDGAGCMAAVMGIRRETIEELCRAVTEDTSAVVGVANYNGPGQFVISGNTAAVDTVIAGAKEAGARRIMKLPISVPCHCSLLDDAAATFEQSLKLIENRECRVPVIPNYDPHTVYTGENLKSLLAKQLNSPVRWEETINTMAGMGIDTIVEIGPKRTLSGLIKRIHGGITLLNIENVQSLNKTMAKLKSL